MVIGTAAAVERAREQEKEEATPPISRAGGRVIERERERPSFQSAVC